MYNLRKLVHNGLGWLQNLPESRQATRQTAHAINITVNLIHESFNIVAVTRSRNARKDYLHFGDKDARFIRQIKTGV